MSPHVRVASAALPLLWAHPACAALIRPGARPPRRCRPAAPAGPRRRRPPDPAACRPAGRCRAGPGSPARQQLLKYPRWHSCCLRFICAPAPSPARRARAADPTTRATHGGGCAAVPALPTAQPAQPAAAASRGAGAAVSGGGPASRPVRHGRHDSSPAGSLASAAFRPLLASSRSGMRTTLTRPAAAQGSNRLRPTGPTLATLSRPP